MSEIIQDIIDEFGNKPLHDIELQYLIVEHRELHNPWLVHIWDNKGNLLTYDYRSHKQAVRMVAGLKEVGVAEGTL